MSNLTIFSVPKAFEGHTGVIQANAIQSWSRISEDVQVLLVGDDPGVKEFATEHSVPHIPEVKRNERGTPMLDDVFRTAFENCQTDYMMFVNCDIVLTSSVLEFIRLIDAENAVEDFLGIGMRVDFDQFDRIDFEADWQTEIKDKAFRDGEYASILCKDYFIFRRGQFTDIPAFSIGRGNWDSWMVSEASRRKLPIIDGTNRVFAGHQNHDYDHVGGRMSAYLSGDEARKNIELAGGRHYIKGSLATHAFGKDGKFKKVNQFPWLTFMRDSPRLFKQLLSFWSWKSKSNAEVSSAA